jgi:cytoskeletal protein CcmA (bactofilin family)
MMFKQKDNTVKISKAKTPESTMMSTIANGTKIKGNLNASSPIRIDGELKGDITSDNKIVLGPQGFISGNIVAKEIIISGTVEGTIRATSVLTLESEANVSGDIAAKEFIIESGAQFNGACEMLEHTPTVKFETKQAQAS